MVPLTLKCSIWNFIHVNLPSLSFDYLLINWFSFSLCICWKSFLFISSFKCNHLYAFRMPDLIC